MSAKSNGNGSNGDGGGRRRQVRTDAEIARLAMQYRIPTIKLEEYEIDRAIIDLVPGDLCTRHTVIPVSRAGSSLIVAMVDPSDTAAREALKAHTGLVIEAVISTELAICTAIAKYYVGLSSE
jgi:type IV pilus assembly protein PilB